MRPVIKLFDCDNKYFIQNDIEYLESDTRYLHPNLTWNRYTRVDMTREYRPAYYDTYEEAEKVLDNWYKKVILCTS